LRSKDFSNEPIRVWTAIPWFAVDFAAAAPYLIAARIGCDGFPETGNFPCAREAAGSAAACFVGVGNRIEFVAPREIVFGGEQQQVSVEQVATEENFNAVNGEVMNGEVPQPRLRGFPRMRY